MNALIKPSHKAIQAYHDRLRTYSDHAVTHEGGLRSAFQQLLEETGRAHRWTLIAEQALKIGGRTVRPDGTFRDEWHLPCGYWEAKDAADDLDAEVRKKAALGYPLSNTIFEDTRRAILFQNGREALRVPLDEPPRVADLLNAFYAHTKPDIEGFKQAVRLFHERIPDLARALNDRIVEAHRTNPEFQKAFADFHDLCRTSLNPNLRREAVDEMLVQHLLTERLFRTVFDNPDFTRRNVIAVEIERVITALASRSFSRDEFLRKLDHFYKAIEDAARTLEDWSDKQHFLNTVYERFFQGYSVKVADTHGIVYTPQEIVDFMCASVEEVLRTEFGLGLGDKGVTILDPCTGTGNFVVNMLRRIPGKDLPRAYRESLFANEVMLLPYYIAAMNIEHAYYERTGRYGAFEGLCFVDTLGLAESEQAELSFMTEENTARVNREKKAPINVIIGNPPYNLGQINESDNNKNRKYKLIEQRIGDTFAADSTATNKNALSDVYVKFFRWAIDRLQGRDGIVCFVSNNSFFQGIAFDGVRKHLAREFDLIYHFDTRGNKRLIGMRQTLDGRNVFNDMVRVGVAITLLIRRRATRQASGCSIHYHAVGDRMKTREKIAYLATFTSVADVSWTPLVPDAKHSWLVPDNASEYEELVLIGSKGRKLVLDQGTIFGAFSVGVKSNRDEIVYDYDPRSLASRVKTFVEDYNAEVDRYARKGGNTAVDDFVRYDRIKWSESLKNGLRRRSYAQYDESRIREGLYRAYCKQHIYFDRTLIERVYLFPSFFPTPETEHENRAIVVSDIGYRAFSFAVLMANCIADLHLCASSDAHQCFPFYTYDEDGTNRRENITDWALDHFRSHYKAKKITKWDIFHYVYGLLHHPGYRTKFADNLKRELPRIPLAPDFRAFAEAGRKLAELHVGYEAVEPWPLDWIEAEGVPPSYRVEKMKLSKDKTALRVNDWLTLAGLPPEAFAYRLGNRSALEWVIDQYQVKALDGPGGPRTSDPNRPDDERYIIDLIGKVTRVSVETVRIVESLPPEFAPPPPPDSAEPPA